MMYVYRTPNLNHVLLGQKTNVIYVGETTSSGSQKDHERFVHHIGTEDTKDNSTVEILHYCYYNNIDLHVTIYMVEDNKKSEAKFIDGYNSKFHVLPIGNRSLPSIKKDN